ncbi:uncharacterized protein ColSpa_00503 [Colletotrichum spaethianum]|uniref:C2H2-type domain-containing protein n=1 Tax=Colletotrichum spaethianum TaxID=700344 RepID=A0AA37L1W2_9PEZI|nr:uncharacterized protein ColSpa_00503 [Colletotrichum spaethianum]GKT40322.1 hypothetical protein ColSpa_00503 [Colletotrichum spaethianum]
MSPEDIRLLRELAGRYGSGSLENTLRSLGSTHTPLRPPPQHHQQQQHVSATARHSNFSTSTFGSNHTAPSLTSSGPWSSSDASVCGSDAASLAGSLYGGQQAQSTWNDANDVPFLLSPSLTPSISGSEWQDLHINEHLTSPSRDKQVTAVKSPCRRKPIECPMCAVYDVYVGFGRKSDFKKHLQNFHNTDCLWACPQRGCRMVFDFEKAYVTHFKIDHSDVHPPPEQVKVELCTQVVFACGFLGCKEVIEASDDGAAAAAADRFFDHLAGHFDKRSAASSEWTFYHQMQNLLRQRALKDDWKHTLWDKAARNQLRWQPRSSGDLKKLLECRHLADVPRVLHAAWTLGQTSFSSPEQPAPDFPGKATRPLRHQCPLSITGHNELHRGSFGQRQPVFHTTLATVSHPPPRTAPDEPDSLAYPHPGTPLVLPERDAWSTDVVLGPRENEFFDDPMLYAGGGNPSHISPWAGAHSLGGLEQHAQDDHEPFGTFLTVPPHSKRPGSWAMKSIENLRLKRRGRPSPVEEKATVHPAWI